MELIKQAYVDRPTSLEISKLTNEIHALANECAMHGWDYRPLLRANELLEAYAVAPEPKKWVAQLRTNNAYDDQGRLVEWNNCELIEYEVSEDYEPQTNEVIIIAPSRDEAFEKMIAAYCPNDTEIRMTATGYFIIENQ